MVNANALSEEDLRDIAMLVKRANTLFIDDNGEYKLDQGGGAITGAWRIPVLRPDAFSQEDVVGFLVSEEGWIGFEFGEKRP